ncbi:response regulator [Amycolatopsis sp. NPDC059021]|uniref:response regulator transcription factor n=1 Tax=Amycolatopsis sp. NPDC059021 TaxID=3346704 RepID=UPI00366FD538
MDHVTTLVVDDQPLIRYALRLLLENSAEVRAVTEAGSETEALRQCERTHPRMVITELSISGEPAGAGICQFAKERLDNAAVLVFSGDSSPAAVATALNAGADSFVHKSADRNLLMEAVRSTLAGQRAWVLGTEPAGVAGEATQHTGTTLTSREEEVLALVLCRWSNDEIAGELHLARQTVKNYVSRILQKLGYGSRKELFKSFDFTGGTPPVGDSEDTVAAARNN